MRIGIATDQGGFGVKEELVARIGAAGHEVVDFGAHSLNPSDDYWPGSRLGSRPNLSGHRIQQRPATSSSLGQGRRA